LRSSTSDNDRIRGGLQLAIKHNPHLGRYLREHAKAGGEMPAFMPQLSRDMGDPKTLNVIYPVGDPLFIHATGSDEQGKRYIVIEPDLTEAEDEKMYELRDILFDKAGYETFDDTPGAFEEMIDRLIAESVVVDGEKRKFSLSAGKRVVLTRKELMRIKYYIKRDLVYTGVLEPLTRDPYIEDIHCIGAKNISVIHKIFKTMETDMSFKDDEALDFYLRGMSERIGKPVSQSRPIVDAALPDGSRINIIYSDDVSIKGPSFTIRKFASEPLSIIQLVKWNTLSPMIAAYLWICLESGMNIFVSGETASGKTTTLNGMLPFIPYNHKIFTVEDTAEVLPPHRIWQRLLTREMGPEESRVDMFSLLKAALRSRPNYIIVGEIRGKEGAVAFQAMQTGHACMATFHASSVKKMIQRMTGDPINVPVRFIDNLNVVLIQQAVYTGGKVLRRCTSIGEIIGYSEELKGIVNKEVFKWDPVTDKHRFRGMNNSYILEQKIAAMRGYADKRQIYRELLDRTKIIERLVNNNVYAYRDFIKFIEKYQIKGG